jgi:hypothetical protein
MNILTLWTRSQHRVADSRVARVVGSQLAALLVAVLVNPPPAALRDLPTGHASAPARDAAPGDRH